MKALPVESERGGGSAVDPEGGAGAGPPVAVGDVPHPLPYAGEGGEAHRCQHRKSTAS